MKTLSFVAGIVVGAAVGGLGMIVWILRFWEMDREKAIQSFDEALTH